MVVKETLTLLGFSLGLWCFVFVFVCNCFTAGVAQPLGREDEGEDGEERSRRGTSMPAALVARP